MHNVAHKHTVKPFMQQLAFVSRISTIKIFFQIVNSWRERLLLQTSVTYHVANKQLQTIYYTSYQQLEEQCNAGSKKRCYLRQIANSKSM